MLAYATPKLSSANFVFEHLDGAAFDDALSGKILNKGNATLPATLESPKLRYYYPVSGVHLLQGKDTRQFFVASVPVPKQTRRKVIGMIEIEDAGFAPASALLKYISVDPDYQGRGIARRLLGMLTEHLKQTNQELRRSRPGKTCPPEFTTFVTARLTGENIPWTQSSGL